MIKKYKAKVTREDEYLIEIDTEIWTKQEIKSWSESFYDADSAKDIVKHLSYAISSMGLRKFYEGFGYVKMESESGKLIDQYKDGSWVPLSEDDYVKGLKVTILTHDEDYNTELKIINS